MESLFASRTISVHLLRGLIGFALLYAAWRTGTAGWGSAGIAGAVLLLAGAMAVLRFCPTCWAIGLVQTLANRPRTCPTPR